MDPKVIAVLGYTAREFTAQKIFESIHPEDVSYFLNFENEVTSFFSQLPVSKVLKYKVSYENIFRQDCGVFHAVGWGR